jgi:hypothetical protein
MHAPEYHYGKIQSLFSIQDKDTFNNWHFSGSIKRAFDKTVKGYVCVLDNNSKISAPKDYRQKKLDSIQTFILIQCKVLHKASFNLEVAYTCTKGFKRRVIFYGGAPYVYQKDNIHRHPLHCRVPSALIVENMWLNLQFDILSFTQ